LLAVLIIVLAVIKLSLAVFNISLAFLIIASAIVFFPMDALIQLTKQKKEHPSFERCPFPCVYSSTMEVDYYFARST